jgi:2-polyprenyl-6-methoxyphenol hydroxylase-like FAD-dependent oxidoreductase
MPSPAHDMTCCIVGGGPAGMVLGLLLARAGVRTAVHEKHADFLRDFRGDTVHPSTLRIVDELGLLDAFLELPHEKLRHLSGVFGEERVALADFSGLPERYSFIALMPQWDFLDFLAEQARRLPALDLRMRSEVEGLVEEGGRVVGVRGRAPDGPFEMRATLVVGCDGRHSTVRASAGLPLEDVGAPIDVLWFRVPRDPAMLDDTLLRVTPGRIVVTLARGDYWQCAFVIQKGGAQALHAQGIAHFRREVAAAVPMLAKHVDAIGSWDDVKLLSVSVDRLVRWSRPGLLCIGDAAHAMSPIGGVGINLAIQDAVATANLLGAKLRAGALGGGDLEAVQRRRMFATRLTQQVQVTLQEHVLAPVLSGANASVHPPLPMRLLSRLPTLRRFVARVVGMGVRPEHVRLPAA